MTIRRIRKDSNPVLRQLATPVDVFDAELERLAADMLETMQAADGIGLAAPQVGVSKRLIVVGVSGVIVTMANPVILHLSGQQRSVEGCLSVARNLWSQPVVRAAQLRVEYQGTDGVLRQWNAKGLRAACIQHEIDHLDGILFTDRINARASEGKS